MSRRRSERRKPTDGATERPDPACWLSLTDDELLHQIETLPQTHDADDRLLEIVRSNRHFFVRQEAAKRLRDREALKAHAHDRHVGQILARMMTRQEDVAYLERLRDESQHHDVRQAAEAQLRGLLEHLRPRAHT